MRMDTLYNFWSKEVAVCLKSGLRGSPIAADRDAKLYLRDNYEWDGFGIADRRNQFI